MKNGKYSYLSKNVILFSLSGFVPKILSFLLIPIYTWCLSEAEYGVSELITTTVQLLIPIFTLDIQDAVMRFALDKNYKQSQIFSVATRIIGIGTALVAIGATVTYFLPFVKVEAEYLIFTVVMFVTHAFYNSASLFCRGIDKVKMIVVGSVCNSIVTLGCNILFLVAFQWGLTGFLVANSLGSLAALIVLFFGAKLHRYIEWKTQKGLAKEMIGFSLPLIFSCVAWWVNNASDRYIVGGLLGTVAVGVYGIAYKIPNLLSVFQNVFTQAWSISAIKEFDKEDKDGFIGNMYNMVNFAMVTVCSLLIILNMPVAKLLYSKDFFAAWEYVPCLLLSVVFNAMALFIGSIFTAVKDTKTLALSTIIGALVNIAGNFLFIHLWGAYGAAVATLLGYAVTLLMRHIILRKHIRMKIKWARDILVYLLVIGQIALAWLEWWSIPFQSAILIVIMLLYLKEIKNVFAMIKSKLFRKKAKAEASAETSAEERVEKAERVENAEERENA